MNFKEKYKIWSKRNEECLHLFFNDPVPECVTLTDSVKYSLFAGGKRIRPVLMYAVCELIDMIPDKTVDIFAAVLEMIHTSSLIHDDLPSMDNDVLRRGCPTNHMVYGEATAILAGDTLMFDAFHIAASHIYHYSFSKGGVKALWKLGYASGYNGMTGGQVIDMESKREFTDLNRLILMNSKKTGALIDFAIKAPIYLTETEDLHEKNLDIFSMAIGQAFQIKDDILDYESNVEILGKSTSDEKNNKSTFVTVLGIDSAKNKLEECIDTACKAIKVYGGKADFLMETAQYIKNRSK